MTRNWKRIPYDQLTPAERALRDAATNERLARFKAEAAAITLPPERDADDDETCICDECNGCRHFCH